MTSHDDGAPKAPESDASSEPTDASFLSLAPEDSIMPALLPPPRTSNVLPNRERTERVVDTRDAVPEEPAPAKRSKLPLVLGGVTALVLMALPLPMLLDSTVSFGPRMGLLALFALPPVVFMVVVQGRYGKSGAK